MSTAYLSAHLFIVLFFIYLPLYMLCFVVILPVLLLLFLLILLTFYVLPQTMVPSLFCNIVFMGFLLLLVCQTTL